MKDNDYSINIESLLKAIEYQDSKKPFCGERKHFNRNVTFGNVHRAITGSDDLNFLGSMFCDIHCGSCGTISTVCMKQEEMEATISELYYRSNKVRPKHQTLSGERMTRFMQSLSKCGVFSSVCRCDQERNAQSSIGIFSGGADEVSPWMISIPVFHRVDDEPEDRATVSIYCRNCGMKANIETLARYFMTTEAMVSQFEGRDLAPYQEPKIFAMNVSKGVRHD